MLSEMSVVVGWSWTPGAASTARERSEPWRDLDRQLRTIAKRRAELVAEREAGDAPSSDPKPNLRPRNVTMKLKPAEEALLREARKRAEADRGERLDDGELMRELCTRYLADEPDAGKASRPRHQIAVTVCRTCQRGWQNGAGREIAIRDTDVERAMCDAEVISLEKPGRASKTIPAAIRKAVLARDHYRCTVPGCRSSRNLDVHHLEHLEHGGTHAKDNLTTLCDGHHVAHHDGRLLIRGPAAGIEVIWLAEVPHVGDSANAEQAQGALRNLGFTRDEARGAVERALAQVGDTELEPLLRVALRECPKPTS
jgi:hypothetical protein